MTLDILGANLRFDHFLHNGEYVDLGYGLSGRAGLNFDGAGFSASASFVALFGRISSKFEFTLGPNLPLGGYSWDSSLWYEKLHLGLGYRYVPDGSPLTLRVGLATTGILHLGVGLKFPN